jgi:hypothetical protein
VAAVADARARVAGRVGIHHVHPGAGERGWDAGFVIAGLVLVAAGYWLARLPRPEPAGAALPAPAR